ncbi:SubName: Full=Related to SKT5-protoplast regeneration and killer toxin resistance protein {ECO:0000313/EMBL:CCA78014.1} [Serendipita indica DSM 11827]|nr:SubName: Full=Related to SKT5-protoplast regeneration and killer toxin resistance protein {ECO:0000313/EMBL:CCA78014.1} [Serendipita indica DSM 11827]
MSAPQLPPRPPQPPSASTNNQNSPPPVPPPPPIGFRPDLNAPYNPSPYVANPLVAPRPQKLMSSVPAEMARNLEAQMPATPAPPPVAYGQQVPSIAFTTPTAPAAYASSPYSNQNPPYQGQPYNPSYTPNSQFRGNTPLPYPGTPLPYQMQQQQPLAYTGLPPAGFAAPPRMGASPAPPMGPNLTPGFTPRPQSWGGTASPAPSQSPVLQRPGSSGIGSTPAPGHGNMQSLQQGLQALSLAGIQTPAPNPNWVHGSTPPSTRPPSSMSPAPGQPPPANRYNIDNSIAGLTFGGTVPPPQQPQKQDPPQLTVQLPTVPSLTSALNGVMTTRDQASKVAWCKDVLSALDRAIQANGANPGEETARKALLGTNGTMSESDAALLKLAETAVATIMTLLAPPLPTGPNNSMPAHIAEALFLRGQVIAAGSFPDKLPKSPRDAFRDFEAAARGGYAPAWFKLGRDYETVGDLVRAKDCFERGMQRGVGSCFYRLGMAYLQGQLNLPQNPGLAMPLLQRAAFLSSIEVPQPAYVYALLLLQEFPHITLPQDLLQSLVPASHPGQTNPNTPPPSLMSESRKYLERSAYLCFGPALYKLGQSYEHALPPFPYDPLMSVQYYSLASQQGDPLADLALSKWFLVGSNPDADPKAPPGHQMEGFDKDETLALIFAEKAASKGEAGGEFAMGYYCEVGIGRSVDLREAKGWYERAAKQGHEDAKARLRELAKENPKTLGVQEHQGRLERMRTNAKEKMRANTANSLASNPAGGLAPPPTDGGMLSPVSSANVVAMARKSSTIHHAGSGRRRPGGMQDFGKSEPPPPVPVPAPKPSDAAKPNTLAPPSTSTTPASKPATSSAASPGGKQKPATFEEMGYYSQKLEDKDCVVM